MNNENLNGNNIQSEPVNPFGVPTEPVSPVEPVPTVEPAPMPEPQPVAPAPMPEPQPVPVQPVPEATPVEPVPTVESTPMPEPQQVSEPVSSELPKKSSGSKTGLICGIIVAIGAAVIIAANIFIK